MAWLTVTIFQSLTARADLLEPEVLFHFRPQPGPNSKLVQGSDGNFYATGSGGAWNKGTVVSITTNGTLTTVVTFDGTNGTGPSGGLTLGPDGAFYGTTGSGGDYRKGTVFRMTANGTLTTLASFDGTNGAAPAVPLTLGPDGGLYGTTRVADNGYGTVFRFTTNGALTLVAAFTAGNYGWNLNGLTLGQDGSFYGTTTSGGFGYGTVFKVTTNGSLTEMASFNGLDGANPIGMTLGSDGHFYGTTYRGGSADLGTVFKMTTNGTVTRLVSFTGPNGSYPGGLTLLNGNFYGTTRTGGTLGFGTVFRVIPSGALTTLRSLANTNGSDPGDLALGRDGSFYGTTGTGGAFDLGTVFKVTPNGLLTTLVSFKFGEKYPGPVILGDDGNLYGTTRGSDAPDFPMLGNGVVFQITTNGAMTVLASFAETNGANPRAALVSGSDGSFYGTTYRGGTSGRGTVFRVTTNGTLTALVSFDGPTGANPQGALILGRDGNIYGTTSKGGAFDLGTVFRTTTNGTLTTLVSFDGPTGANPVAELVEGRDGSFYGTTPSGGSANLGTVFKVASSGALTSLASFAGTNGANPLAGLVEGEDGSFYGTTASGGDRYPVYSTHGTVFKVTTNGTLTILVSFRGDPEGSPYFGLTLGDGGNFYGTAAQTIFKVTTNGTVTTLVPFSGTNGATPEGLTRASDGSFYGATTEGGVADRGTVFRLRLPEVPTILVQPSNLTNLFGTTATLVVHAVGAEPLSYHWRKNSSDLTNGGNILGAFADTLTLGNVTPADAGTYSVRVGNNLNSAESSDATLTVLGTVAVPEALDTTNLLFSGFIGWFGQTNLAHDGVDAAQTAPDASAGLQTVITKPGTLRFWWKMAPRSDFEEFYLRLNGSPLASVHGTVDWQQVTIEILPGLLEWSYQQLLGIPGGSGWLDQVEFTPGPGPAIRACDLLGNGQFRLRFESMPGASFSALVSTNLTDWTALGPATEVAPGHFEFTDSDAPNHPARFYQLRSP